MIRCTLLAQYVVARPMVPARARPDSFETPKASKNDVDRERFCCSGSSSSSSGSSSSSSSS
eukprot:16423511-Heterocapsa_arctica.AAC.1